MKEEILKKAAKNYKDLKLPDDLYDGFIAGAKWQSERMYNEEQMRDCWNTAFFQNVIDDELTENITFENFIKQLKK